MLSSVLHSKRAIMVNVESQIGFLPGD